MARSNALPGSGAARVSISTSRASHDQPTARHDLSRSARPSSIPTRCATVRDDQPVRLVVGRLESDDPEFTVLVVTRYSL